MRDLQISDTGETPSFSVDPARADYASPAYREMLPRWVLVDDVRAGSTRYWAKKETYLPKFEAEEPADWLGRVAMTFAEDQYEETIVDHVGLIFSEPIKLGDDVPPAIQELLEDIDGEGNHLDVFANDSVDTAMHLGHCGLLTDYPVPKGVTDATAERKAKLRPYVTLYRANDIYSSRTEVVGGVLVLVQVMLRERGVAAEGEFGVSAVETFREFRQEVIRDDVTNAARGLGAIAWRTLQRPAGKGAEPPVPTGEGGVVVGPERIPLRVIYGGEKLGHMHTKPHLWSLSLKCVEEAQVQSDYASVMHKCNVPTPVFIGRQAQAPGTEGAGVVKMGQGIDIPIGGDAKMLEPAGTAITETRERLDDIRESMLRKGATSGGPMGRDMTAMEAGIYAKQRNAKLVRVSRSAQDAFEGVLQDMAAYMKLPSGGSLEMNREFSAHVLDPAYLAVVLAAYDKGTLDIDEVRFAMKNGRLPDEMAELDATLRLVAEQAAKTQADADAAAEEAEKAAKAEAEKTGVAA